jgi:hypothetical protein
MISVHKKEGETIIREGEDGDNLYVVEIGTLTCTKIFVSTVEIKYVLGWSHGAHFPQGVPTR